MNRNVQMIALVLLPACLAFGATDEWGAGALRAHVTVTTSNELHSYTLHSNAELRENKPPSHQFAFSEMPTHPRTRTGNVMFDSLYALAVHEAVQNSVSQIKDGAYNHGAPIQINAFQTGEFWTYVWTRDLSYSAYLALGGFDPERAVNSLLFKSSTVKPSITGGWRNQIVQDTGSGGSYPVSSDRIVWIFGADETLDYLAGAERKSFLTNVYTILHDTVEQDRQLVFDATDGLYRGEESFQDWREQTYPATTRTNVLPIAMSKALSVNCAYYFALTKASEYAGQLGHRSEQRRYAAWAKDLKKAVNAKLFDSSAGLYCSYLWNDAGFSIPIKRYDLLGESLAILSGVADRSRADSILRNYPTGPFGSPVVWPQEKGIPIYHNHAIWPFVTAFWLKAAAKADNTAAIDSGIHSLMRGSAFNLSNLENFDFVTGSPEVKDGSPKGPVINSRRQLWSVAGYLSMVQDVVFGLDTSTDGIRFLPHVPRNLDFGDTLELENFSYHGKIIHVRIYLSKTRGASRIDRILLNGKIIGNQFVSADTLRSQNDWEIYLAADTDKFPSLRIADVSDKQSLFAPSQPEWTSDITTENGLLVLHYRGAPPFNIYRDGQLCAKEIAQTMWTDPKSADFRDRTHFYTIQSIAPQTGNASYPAPTHFYNSGNLTIQNPTNDFTVSRNGHYFVRVEFSNSAGALNTGITCAVKKMEISAGNSLVASGYLIMPQSGEKKRYDLSSIIEADLKAGTSYSIHAFEDAYSRNMSYLERNETYTALPGGGPEPYNRADIRALHLLRISK
jgi:hypothetical protein